MARKDETLFDRLLFRRSLRRWTQAADGAGSADLTSLHRSRSRARSLRQQLDRVIHAAEYRLTLPVIGSDAMPKLAGTDWAWRPDLWKGPIPVTGQAGVADRTAICTGATLFHDCRQSEVTYRQIRNTRAADIAAFGFRLDVFQFDGTFLSLVFDLPPEAAQGLRLRHIIRLDMIAETEKPLQMFARLNIKHGPNVEQITREIAVQDGVGAAEFDLAYTRMNEMRVEKLWIDLIFEGPQMNQIILRDVTVGRRPRADF